ncbi:hypothetical protein SCALM49S_09626 [Streptomyces californicus]
MHCRPFLTAFRYERRRGATARQDVPRDGQPPRRDDQFRRPRQRTGPRRTGTSRSSAGHADRQRRGRQEPAGPAYRRARPGALRARRLVGRPLPSARRGTAGHHGLRRRRATWTTATAARWPRWPTGCPTGPCSSFSTAASGSSAPAHSSWPNCSPRHRGSRSGRRRPLGAVGELCVEVPPLSAGDDGDDAVRLFRERAAAVAPDLALDDPLNAATAKMPTSSTRRGRAGLRPTARKRPRRSPRGSPPMRRTSPTTPCGRAATARCAPRSAGATNCAPRWSSCGRACRSSTASSWSRTRRRSARAVRWSPRPSPRHWSAWPTSRCSGGRGTATGCWTHCASTARCG